MSTATAPARAFHAVSPATRRKLRGRPDSFPDLFGGPDDLDAARAMLADPGRFVVSSELMAEFARRLGISGEVMTSYEYLREGDVEEVPGWDEFVHVPDQGRKEARMHRAAAEVEERKRRLTRDGLLLAERMDRRPSGTAGHPFVRPDRDGGGFWIVADAGVGGGGRPSNATARLGRSGPVDAGLSLGVPVWGVASSTSGRFLLASHGLGHDRRIDLWDMEARRLVETTPSPPGSWYGFLPDESGWVGVSEGGGVVTPFGEGREPTVLEVEGARCAAIHPSGATLVIGDRRNRLHFVDLATGRSIKILFVGGPSRTTGVPAAAGLFPEVGEAVARLAEGLDLERVEEARRRRQAEAALLLDDDQVLSGRVPDPPHVEGLAEARERIRGRFLQAIEEQQAAAREAFPANSFSLLPKETVFERLEQSTTGAVAPLCPAFDPEGRWLGCGTVEGVLAFSWRDLLTAISATPVPRHSAEAAPYAETDNDGVAIPCRHVHDLAFDPRAGRLLFATLGGEVGFLELPDGRSGTLVEVPGRPPIVGVELTRDGSALGVVCRPDLHGRRRFQRQPYVQIWSYEALEGRLPQPEPTGD